MISSTTFDAVGHRFARVLRVLPREDARQVFRARALEHTLRRCTRNGVSRRTRRRTRSKIIVGSHYINFVRVFTSDVPPIREGTPMYMYMLAGWKIEALRVNDETFVIIDGESYANGAIPSESVCMRR